MNDVRATVGNRQPGKYRVTLWNTTEGEMEQTCLITVKEGHEQPALSLVLALLGEEIALAVVRV